MNHLTILLDFLLASRGLASEQMRHRAFRFLLPPSETSEVPVEGLSWLERLSIRSRPKERPWYFGMTSSAEQAYCEWYASRLYTGKGALVDLGCWLGSLTIPLGKGLSSNTRISRGMLTKGSRVIHAYDQFRWHPAYDGSVKGTCYEGRFEEGESYLPLVKELIGEISHLVELHRADLRLDAWIGEPIEFLIVDAMKCERTARGIQQSFFAHLIPGIGYLVHQDYKHCYESWIHIAMFLLRDCFQPVCEIPIGASYVFRCRKEIPSGDLDYPDSVKEFPVDLIEKAYAWNLNLVSEPERDKIAAAHTMVYVHREEIDQARKLFRNYCAFGPFRTSSEFQTMNDWLKEDRGLDLSVDP